MTEFIGTGIIKRFDKNRIKDYIWEKGEQVINNPEISLSKLRIYVCDAIEHNWLIDISQYTNSSKIQQYVNHLKLSGKGELLHRPVDTEGLQNLEVIEKILGTSKEIQFLKKIYQCDCIHKFPELELCNSDMDMLATSLLYNYQPEDCVLGFIGAQMIFENVLFRENGFYNVLVSRMKDIVGRFQ